MITLHHKSRVDINPTHDNNVRSAEMIGQIAEDIRDTLANQMQAGRYLSVLVDGDTDISNMDGRPVTRLVGQQSIEHRTR